MQFTKRINPNRRRTTGKRPDSIMMKGKKKTTLPTQENWAAEHTNDITKRSRSIGRKRGSKFVGIEQVVLNPFFDNQGDDWTELQSVLYFEDSGINYVRKNGLGGLVMHQSAPMMEIGKDYKLVFDMPGDGIGATTAGINAFQADIARTQVIVSYSAGLAYGVHEFDFTAAGDTLSFTAAQGADWLASIQVFTR